MKRKETQVAVRDGRRAETQSRLLTVYTLLAHVSTDMEQHDEKREHADGRVSSGTCRRRRGGPSPAGGRW